MTRITLALLSAMFAFQFSTTAMADSEDPNAHALEYRKSIMTLIGQNFGPMVGMIKQEIPWDDEAFKGFARDLEHLASLNLKRGYREGSHVGKTKAKPEIWENKADFESKMQDMAEALKKLAKAAEKGEKKDTIEAFKNAGGTCKSCHDDYKSKVYLN